MRLYPSDSKPKRGNTKMGNEIDINLYKSAKAKTQCHSLPYSVLRIRNDQCKHFKCGFTPDSNPKLVKKKKKGGNKIGSYLCKRTKVKITDIAYIRLLRVWTDQCKNLKLGFIPDCNPKMGKKKGVTKLTCIILCKNSMLKPVPYRTLGFPSTERSMEAILGLPLLLTVLPKGVKRGNKSYICLCKTFQG